MNQVGVGAWLVLAAVAGLTAASLAQEAARGQALNERLREIQGAPLGTSAPPPTAAQTQAPPQTAAAAPGALDENAVRTLLQDSFGVEILRVHAIESDGRPAYAVTVMNPPGNSNGAFLVETLLVDGVTGALLGRMPEVPRVASGLAAPTGLAAPEGTGPEIRRRTYR
jgi:hypothetical protein